MRRNKKDGEKISKRITKQERLFKTLDTDFHKKGNFGGSLNPLRLISGCSNNSTKRMHKRIGGNWNIHILHFLRSSLIFVLSQPVKKKPEFWRF